MMKPFLTTATLALLLSATARAADIGAVVDVPCPFGDCKAGISLSYLGEYDIPTGFRENGVEVGGLSGIDFDPSTGRYISISDDRSERAPARFYDLDIDVGADELKGVTVLDHVTLKDKNGQPFAFRTVDSEFDPYRQGRHLLEQRRRRQGAVAAIRARCQSRRQLRA